MPQCGNRPVKTEDCTENQPEQILTDPASAKNGVPPGFVSTNTRVQFWLYAHCVLLAMRALAWFPGVTRAVRAG